ncbi:MAG: hypothetical protein ACE5FL_15425, partial [Myxococcota bacterium]
MKRSSPLRSLRESPRVREAARALLEAVAEEAGQRALRPTPYARALRRLARLRGRGLVFPALSGGTGRGARVQLARVMKENGFLRG